MGAFDDNKKDDKPPQAKQRMGLKLTNQNSVFANVPKKPTAAEQEQAVKEVIKKDQDYKERAAALSIAFKKLLDDRVLLKNKNVFAADMERDVIGKLAQLGLDIENDESVEELGIGIIGLTNLLFRSFLIQRDKINLLDYALHEHQLKLNELELKLNSLVDKPKTDG